MHVLQITKTGINVRQRERLTSGAQLVFPVELQFSDEWNGLVPKAVFTDGSNNVAVVIVDGKANIPAELLIAGKTISIQITGYDDEGLVILPTVITALGTGPVVRGRLDGENETPPTPELSAQILAAAKAAQESAESAEESAENAYASAAESAASAAKLADYVFQAEGIADQVAANAAKAESKASEAEASATHAETAQAKAETAVTAAEAAAELAEQCAATHGFFFFDINDSGMLEMTNSNVEDVDFNLNDRRTCSAVPPLRRRSRRWAARGATER